MRIFAKQQHKALHATLKWVKTWHSLCMCVESCGNAKRNIFSQRVWKTWKCFMSVGWINKSEKKAHRQGRRVEIGGLGRRGGEVGAQGGWGRWCRRGSCKCCRTALFRSNGREDTARKVCERKKCKDKENYKFKLWKISPNIKNSVKNKHKKSRRIVYKLILYFSECTVRKNSVRKCKI